MRECRLIGIAIAMPDLHEKPLFIVNIVFTSHSIPTALSCTRGGFTVVCTWRLGITQDSQDHSEGHTLSSGVSPLTIHSLMCSGASIAHAFAASTNGSLMILTVNSFVALIFSLVSFGFRGLSKSETLKRGGS